MRVLSGLLFFPRGGSAHVARALAAELETHGSEVTLLSGSRSSAPEADATRFYDRLDVRAVDFDAGDAPMHPSYEDRPDAPDPWFGRVDDDAYDQHLLAWAAALEEADAAGHDVLHLHHLTPLHEAAARVAPEVPVATHLHGTELLFLEAVAEGRGGPHGAAWARRMRRWAQASSRVLLLSETQRPRAVDLLGLDPDRCVVVPNGVDLGLFAPREVDRARLWQRTLVDAPRGWRPGAPAGSVAYAAEDVVHLASQPVVVAVGRFSAVKRVGLLVRAFERARRTLPGRPSLVLVGGHPGEWEGEHPVDAIAACGARDVFLAGWHDHDELPELLAAADLLALASVREQFGLVLVEAMACARPVVAVDRFGPAEIVEDGCTGWLVPPDDEAALAEALRAALADPDELARRGERGRARATEEYGWAAVGEQLREVLDAARADDPIAA